MISSKELKYVGLWANKVPMPGYEYSMDILNQIEECYNIFANKYSNKEYSFIFSNSEEIDFTITSKNLCHMLGIDYSNITNNFFDAYRKEVFGTAVNDFNSYRLLELLLEHKEKVAEMDNDSNNNAKAINYYKSAIKCTIFKKFSDFDKFNFAVINYVGNYPNVDYTKEKVLFMPSNEALTPYFMMNIVLDSASQEPIYVVKSLSAPVDPKEYFDDQEVIIPTQILYSDNSELRKIIATPEEKLQLLTMYSNIVNKYGVANNLDISGDYAAVLNEQANRKILTR